jgi:RimJ/RimL family protein N-acetyltransferase
MSRVIPTINTSRLTLRAMEPQDFGRFAEIWAMPEVVRYVGGQPKSRGQAWSSFLHNAGQWQVTGFGQWSIVEQSSKQMIGQTGFFHGTRDLGDDFDHCPEAGWILTPDAQGKGYGREATQAAHDWFDRVVTGPVVCILSPENTASRAVADGLGYTPLRIADFDGDPAQLMTRPKPPR